jgi:ribonucleotide reductase alpha subunit
MITTTILVKEAKNSNLRHRPIGIGIRGLADDLFIASSIRKIGKIAE